MTVKTKKVYDKVGYPLDKFVYGTPFGLVDGWHPNGHRGTDLIPTIKNAKAYAIARGTVVRVMWSSALGNVVVIHTAFGYIGYCHLAKVSVKVNQSVAIGTAIGIAGTTGTASTGVHLHLTLSPTAMGVEYGTVKNVRAIFGKDDPKSYHTENVWAWYNPTASVRAAVIKELRRLGYMGTNESTNDAHLIQSIEKCLKARAGFGGVVNGQATWATVAGMQDFGIKYANYQKKYRDAVGGPNTWDQFLAGLKKLSK